MKSRLFHLFLHCATSQAIVRRFTTAQDADTPVRIPRSLAATNLPCLVMPTKRCGWGGGAHSVNCCCQTAVGAVFKTDLVWKARRPFHGEFAISLYAAPIADQLTDRQDCGLFGSNASVPPVAVPDPPAQAAIYARSAAPGFYIKRAIHMGIVKLTFSSQRTGFFKEYAHYQIRIADLAARALINEHIPEQFPDHEWSRDHILPADQDRARR